jgi:hypothetical protein
MAYNAPSTISTGDLITAAKWNADVSANPIAIYAGALSVTSQAVGDILYASSTTQFARVAAVAAGQVLTSAGTGTVPAYSATPTLTSVKLTSALNLAEITTPTPIASYGAIYTKTDDKLYFQNGAGAESEVSLGAAAFDSTTVDSTTWSDGANASNTWTFDVSGSDTTITFGDGNFAFGADLSNATGDEVAFAINYTTNKATSGSDIGLVLDQTDTASPGTSRMWETRIGGSVDAWADSYGLGVVAANRIAFDDVQPGGYAYIKGSVASGGGYEMEFWTRYSTATWQMSLTGSVLKNQTSYGVRNVSTGLYGWSSAWNTTVTSDLEMFRSAAGIMGIRGLNNTNNESLLIDTETVANEIGFSSASGVTDYSFAGTVNVNAPASTHAALNLKAQTANYDATIKVTSGSVNDLSILHLERSDTWTYFKITHSGNNWGTVLDTGPLSGAFTNFSLSGVVKLALPANNNFAFTSLLDVATGNEAALTVNYTTNKATSGNDTGLVVNQTDTASPGVSLLADFQVGGASKFSVSNTGDVYTTAYTDYYASSTIVGWSSLSAGRRYIMTKKIGKTVFVWFHLEGTSDGTRCSFTLPFTSTSVAFGNMFGGPLSFTYNNTAAVAIQGVALLPINSNVCTCDLSPTVGDGWTASGSKIIAGNFFYESA